jgi:uncharacterized coiled-coil protein SlyX
MTEKDLKARDDKIARLKQIVKDQEQTITKLSSSLDEHTKLAEQAAEVMEGMDTNELAGKAGKKVEETVDDAVETPSEVSDETKNAIVDAVGQIDPELASELTNEFSKADMADEVVDGEKLGRSVLKILDKIALSNKGFTSGRTRVKANDKTASRTGRTPYSKRVMDEIDTVFNS